MFSQEFLKEVVEWARALIGALILTAIIIYFIRPTVVYGPSMEPSFHDKEYLLISKAWVSFKGVERDDVLIFKTHLKTDSGTEKNLIKRVIGLPGDHIHLENGKVYVNDNVLTEDYTDGSPTTDFGQSDWDVGNNEYFVLGDNRDNSKDSRFEDVGLVKKSTIMGKVVFRIFPFNKAGAIH